jgi:hypothetical protein
MGDLFTSAYVDLSPAAVSAAVAKGFPTDGANAAAGPYTATLGSNLQPEEQKMNMKIKMMDHKPSPPAFDALARFRPEPEDQDDSDSEEDEGTPYVYAYASMLTSSSSNDSIPVLDAKKRAGSKQQQQQPTKQQREEETEGSAAYAQVKPSYVKTTSSYEGAATATTNYSTLVSPRSMDEVPAVQTLTGYSTPVLTKGGAIAYADAYVSVSGGAPARKDDDGGDGDGDYFPVIESTPPPSTPEERAAKAEAKANKAQGFDADAFAEELAVRQKVAELLASLPSSKSRQRVVEQLADADQGLKGKAAASFEVLQPTESIKKEKEWAKASQGRQWNEEYQRVVSKGLKQLKAEDVRAISRLSHDFVKQAEVYAKIIINELNVPDAWCVACIPAGEMGTRVMLCAVLCSHTDGKRCRKTIKPANVGGVAGGAKYIVQGVLFKFCLDPIVSKKVRTHRDFNRFLVLWTR